MYHNLETRINKNVKSQKPNYLLKCDIFDKNIPVSKKGSTKEDSPAIIVVINDIEFARERLRVAKKHVRDYEELPDKGQFPYIKFNRNEKLLIFHGETFIPDEEEAKNAGELIET